MNDTAGCKGLVPTLLVFGAQPRIQVTPIDLPAEMNRMRAMKLARKEMARAVAKERVSKALRKIVPSATLTNLAISFQGLVYREQPENKWTGPYRVIGINNKYVFLDLNGNNHQVSTDKVKIYKPPISSV